jgi:hypothetical protein
MAIQRLYKSTQNSLCYVFKDGTKAFFMRARFSTDIKEQIEELDAEVAKRHPMIFIDDKEREVDTDKVDPIEEIKRQAIAEYLASQNKALQRTNDRGTTDRNAPLTGIVNTHTIAEGASGSASGQDASGIESTQASRLEALRAASAGE